MRLTKTIDLTGASAGRAAVPALATNVEAATTTSSSRRTRSGRTTGRRCPRPAARPHRPAGRVRAGRLPAHTAPVPGHYLGGADCTSPGTTGEWNSFTGSTAGWQQVAFDLSPTPAAGGAVHHLRDRPGLRRHRRLRRRHPGHRRRRATPTASRARPAPGRRHRPPGQPADPGPVADRHRPVCCRDFDRRHVVPRLRAGQLSSDAERSDLVGRALDGLLG